MISVNVRPSSVILIKDTIPAQSLTASAASTGWVKTSDEHKHAIALLFGSIATGAGVTISAQQATDSSGTGAKVLNINGAATAVYVDTDDNKSAILDLDPVDVENTFYYIRATVTTTGAGDAVLVAAALIGVGPKHETGLNPSTT